jgi:hypothetical protein
MKRLSLLLISGFIIIYFFSSWGFFAHKRINRLAIFTLPNKMIRFYKNNINYISEHAVDPDKRRYADSAEASRHFLDADHYGEFPFDSIPEKWEHAVEKFGESYLNKYGTVPWEIERNYYYLVRAFQKRDSIGILRISAQIGHYIADAHVPLHLTKNYNGQLTNQTGIHAFWESRLPELFSDEYKFYTGKAQYIENPLKEAWLICKASYAAVDSTLLLEKKLSETFPSDKKYTFISRGNRLIQTYSEEYSRAYHNLLQGMVERQMRSSIAKIGNFWFSAWVDAGQPVLNSFDQRLTLSEQEVPDETELLYQRGNALGRQEDHD